MKAQESIKWGCNEPLYEEAPQTGGIGFKDLPNDWGDVSVNFLEDILADNPDKLVRKFGQAVFDTDGEFKDRDKWYLIDDIIQELKKLKIQSFSVGTSNEKVREMCRERRIV